MSDRDEYESRFRPTPECYECECGAEVTRMNPITVCDCGASCCLGCIHICEWCGKEGCDTCMIEDVDQGGWRHKNDDCYGVHPRMLKAALDAVYNAMEKPAEGDIP
jgi:hypothetical protein